MQRPKVRYLSGNLAHGTQVFTELNWYQGLFEAFSPPPNVGPFFLKYIPVYFV